MKTFVIVALVAVFAFGVANSMNLGLGYGDVDPFSCKNFVVSTFFSGICGNVSTFTASSQATYCDAHCRCVHENQLGICSDMPPDTIPDVKYGNQLCECSNDMNRRPSDLVSNNCADVPNEPVNNGVLQVICRTQWNDTYGGCTADCKCSHNNQFGYCTGEYSQCICTNNANEIPINYWTQQRNGTAAVRANIATFFSLQPVVENFSILGIKLGK